MSLQDASSERIGRGGAASLSLIKLRRTDRTAKVTAPKSADLTERLRHDEIDVASVPNGSFTSEAHGAAGSDKEIAAPSSFAPPAPPAPPAEPDIPPPAEAAPIGVVPRPVRLGSPGATEFARPRPLSYDDYQSPEALFAYWNALRGIRALPSLEALDRNRIAISWPDSLMVGYYGDPAMPRLSRLSRLTGKIEYTSMVTEWILSCSQQAARAGAAMKQEQDFPGDRGSRTYRMMLLPFCSTAGESNHVLCHLNAI